MIPIVRNCTKIKMNDPKSLHDRHPLYKSPIEDFLNKLPYPMAFVLASAFVFVYALGYIFNRGEQIYPIFNDIPEGMDCPECRVFEDISKQITERQFRITYKVNTNVPITKTHSWRLWRIRISGMFFEQEMRAEDNCGIYSLGTDHTAMHWELLQEGPTRVQLLCLDNNYSVVDNYVTPYPRDTKYSILHANKEASNVCLRPDSKVLVFSNSNIRNVAKDLFLGDYVSLRHDINNISKTAKNVNLGFLLNSKESNTFEMLNNIIFMAFVHSQSGQTISFRQKSDHKKYGKIVSLVSEGKYEDSNHLTCWTRVITEPLKDKVKNITGDEINIIRKLVVHDPPSYNYTVVSGKANPIKAGSRSHNLLINLEDDYVTMVEKYAAAKAMIAFDDNNEIGNAMWLSDKAPLYLIQFKNENNDSHLMKILRNATRIIKPIVIEPTKCESSSKPQHLISSCVNGEVDRNSPDCVDIFTNIKCELDPKLFGEESI